MNEMKQIGWYLFLKCIRCALFIKYKHSLEQLSPVYVWEMLFTFLTRCDEPLDLAELGTQWLLQSELESFLEDDPGSLLLSLDWRLFVVDGGSESSKSLFMILLLNSFVGYFL